MTTDLSIGVPGLNGGGISLPHLRSTTTNDDAGCHSRPSRRMVPVVVVFGRVTPNGIYR